MRIPIGVFLSLALIATAADRPKPVADFVNIARALPPEFHADLLLHVAESKLLAGHEEWRRELLEEAFTVGQRAPEPFPMKGGMHTDSRSFVTALDLGLDAMSLRLRAAGKTLPFDPGRAAAMFRETPVPPLPALTCQSAKYPNFDTYYRVLGLIHKSGFTLKERARGERESLLKNTLANLTDPGQVEPLGRLLVALIFLQWSVRNYSTLWAVR